MTHDPNTMREIIDALEMPRQAVPTWMAHERTFCQAHGGAKVYPELMALFDAVDEAVQAEMPAVQMPESAAHKSTHRTTFLRHPTTVLRRWLNALKRRPTGV
jgi:hypothetical protein